ncbi:IMP dehydrogenase [Vulcanimicrobium alpinum]|uniref:IMP dehydrogenase n=1 Tax=Vulcanimicrobium alpinum TaxID=3016050 RepID=A0AAN1XSA2_UNVUL|nr:alcohol dehydrogenase catalytic domain-containing protein [Vulcanimicrobium alpinum]BDE04940.1 IMP dehydrogenase [Vulcanimicrobium alpinum]
MKATVFHGARDVRVETVPDPAIANPGDAIVRVVNAAICGSDLWPYRGTAPWQPGARLGHEFTGVVEAVGSGVHAVRAGDFVAAPFSFSDGSCAFCRAGLQTSCEHAGFWGGQENDGGQGEFVRVPFADATLVRIPDAVRADERKRVAALALTDVMGTGFHGAKAAGVSAGGTAVVIGDGAVGLCGVIAARYLGAERIVSVGHHPARLEMAQGFGATDVVDSNDPDAAEKIKEITGGTSAVVEAVGQQSSLDLALAVVRDGGTVSFVGVPWGMSTVDFRRLFGGNVALRGALAPVRAYLPELMDALAAGTIDPSPVFTHRLPLPGSPDGYRAMDQREAIKVCLDVSAA